MSARVEFRFDDSLDVLSAWFVNARVVRARTAATDAHIVLKLDSDGHIVGLELLGPSELRPAFWRSHPARTELPADLLSDVDAWLESHWLHLRRR